MVWNKSYLDENSGGVTGIKHDPHDNYLHGMPYALTSLLSVGDTQVNGVLEAATLNLHNKGLTNSQISEILNQQYGAFASRQTVWAILKKVVPHKEEVLGMLCPICGSRNICRAGKFPKHSRYLGAWRMFCNSCARWWPTEDYVPMLPKRIC